MAAKAGFLEILLSLGGEHGVGGGLVGHLLRCIEQHHADFFVAVHGADHAFHELVAAPAVGKLPHLLEQIGGVLPGQVGNGGLGAGAALAMAVGTHGGHLAAHLVEVIGQLGAGLCFLEACVQVHVGRGAGLGRLGHHGRRDKCSHQCGHQCYALDHGGNHFIEKVIPDLRARLRSRGRLGSRWCWIKQCALGCAGMQFVAQLLQGAGCRGGAGTLGGCS